MSFLLPKRRFWKVEQGVAYVFLNEFSRSGSQKLVLTPLKRTSKTHTLCSAIQNLRLGTIILCIPNEDFGKTEPQVSGRVVSIDFERDLRGFVAQIEYASPTYAKLRIGKRLNAMSSVV